MQLNPDFLKKVLPILESSGITQSSQLFNDKGQIDLDKVIAISSKITEKFSSEENVEESKSSDTHKKTRRAGKKHKKKNA